MDLFDSIFYVMRKTSQNGDSARPSMTAEPDASWRWPAASTVRERLPKRGDEGSQASA